MRRFRKDVFWQADDDRARAPLFHGVRERRGAGGSADGLEDEVLDGGAGKGGPRGQQVVEILRSAIIMGNYEPGERLIEATLSTELGTSRGPVREALKQLENEGLVMSFPYRGAVVLGVSEEEIQQVLIDAYAAAIPPTPAEIRRPSCVSTQADTHAEVESSTAKVMYWPLASRSASASLPSWLSRNSSSEGMCSTGRCRQR